LIRIIESGLAMYIHQLR